MLSPNNFKSNIPIGVVPTNKDPNALNGLLSGGEYNCLLLPVTNEHFKKRCLAQRYQNLSDVPYPANHESVIPSLTNNRSVVAYLSSWLTICNSDTNDAQNYYFQVLYNEIAFAQFFGVKTFIYTLENTPQDNQFLYSIAKLFAFFPQIHISVFLNVFRELHYDEDGFRRSYELWIRIKQQCEDNYNLSLSLSLSYPESWKIIDWAYEPLKVVFIPIANYVESPTKDSDYNSDSESDLESGWSDRASSLNAINSHGTSQFYHLKSNLTKILQLKKLNPPVLFIEGKLFGHSEPNYHPSQKKEEKEKESLEKTKKCLEQILTSAYDDPVVSLLFMSAVDSLIKVKIPKHLIFSPAMLQSPIEPFVENLEDALYAEFEKDTHKYAQYERAFIKALINLNKIQKPDEKPHILFVGPGRGPLIDRFFDALNILSFSQTSYNITAIERNHSLLSILFDKNRKSWNNSVNLICMDSMMYPQSEHNKKFGRVRMVISELMGSFGCNELMPECIDSVAVPEVCHPDCIFIPHSIHSYAAPIDAPLLWKYATEKNIHNSMEKIYVPIVPFMKVIGKKPILAWSFESKIRDSAQFKQGAIQDTRLSNCYNSRYASCRALGAQTTTVHGIAGFFEAILYPGYPAITVSNFNSGRNRLGCTSWLPAFLPFKDPIILQEQYSMMINLRRECFGNNVWYEWSAIVEHDNKKNDDEAAVVVVATKIHNLNGKGFKLTR